MAETQLAALLDQEIPDGRQHLQESYVNLEKVAKYCKDNYEQAQDKRAALEETKNYTTHSLASVAYQINSLATNFLKLLDLQANQVAEMESSVNYLSQTVNIHKEKVARKEIGVLTTNRTATRPTGVKNGIIFPEQAERPTKYNRKPIDYSTLDDLGHGVRGPGGGAKQSRSSSISSTASSQAPVAKPPTPPQVRNMGTGSIGKAGGSHYRTPAPPVAPPSVPSHYAPSNYSMGQITSLPGQHRQQRRSSSRSSQGIPAQQQMAPASVPQATPPQAMPPQAPPPPVGMAHPMTVVGPTTPPYQEGPGRVSMGMMHQQSVDNLPPPPSPEMGEDHRASDILEASPPLPPPPPSADQQFAYQPPPPPPEFNDEDQGYTKGEEDPYAATGPDLAYPNWIPQNYMEKVIAIYDYAAEKDDELTFSENALIYVTNKNDDGWWEGVMNGVTGLFPCNYVEPCM